MPTHRRRLLPLLAASLLAFPGATIVSLQLLDPPAAEARSGGSGGGFRRSSGGSSSSSRSSGGSRSSFGGSHGSFGGSYSSGGWSSSGSSGGGGTSHLSPDERSLVHAVVFVVFLLAIIISAVQKALANRAQAEIDRIARERNTVVRIQAAFNALRTKELRAGIERLVRGADLASPVGLGTLAQQVCRDIAAHADFIAFAHVLSEEGLEDAPAEYRFHSLAGEARAFFDREVVRRDARGTTETTRNSSKADELLDEDGSFGVDEFFVVTLVTCVEAVGLGLLREDGAAFDVPNAARALTRLPLHTFAGCEVVWTPAAESDILTRDEVLGEFPQLAPVIGGAPV